MKPFKRVHRPNDEKLNSKVGKTLTYDELIKFLDKKKGNQKVNA